MEYVVDRIIDNIAVLEKVSDKSKIEIDVSSLSFDIYEGCVLIKKDDKFILDNNAQYERRKSILEKFNRAKVGRSNE